ncbi:hypothetical protein [Sulfuricurvum sp.]|uniref:hypothetical protein n=1 Tax=Sulfuricurvum sp. TaxID=2025608 RepID=UPI002E35E140|nr:hypothetical protein [Sulfuricurvum sp.]HEX5328769.1 hypothetical protein [Sulfuricurvum sp.]
MIKRFPLRCDTCHQGIILRIGMGMQKFQTISIQCPECHQKISFEIEVEKENNRVINTSINKPINFTFTQEGEDFIAINLHTEMVYPKQYIHEKTLIPSVFITQSMLKHGISKGFLNIDKAKRADGPFGMPGLFAFDGLGGDSNLLEDWQIIEKAYSLFNSGRSDLMNEELKKYSNVESMYRFTTILHSTIYDFLLRLITPNTLLFNDIKKHFSKAKQKSNHFKAFKNYYKNELQTMHWKNYIDIFSEYFKNFSEFNRLLLNTKIELHPEDGIESIFCPSNFDDVKMFYGNAYEYITTHLTIFACVNNINQNRNYDTFQSMTLKKYNELNKDSKLGPLQTDPIFQAFTLELNSTIRNASHHKWFYIDNNNPGFLLYRSGGTGAINSMSYIDYVYKSNLLIIKLAILAMIEIKFLYK